ncbi:DUF7827 domain-containing protein [Halorussus marinus]|uniref:DUF7827 domain-containing protein n=1 Tax=Halorussus marinus TaxID=2505976 RepID=UPI0014301F68|nr:hypothetical protein [Halorussus marinus]
MLSNPPYGAALAVLALLLAAVAPWVGAAGATAAPSGSFGDNVVYADRGDVLNVTVSTSDAGTVNLGSPKKGFWLQVDVGGGTTELSINTYKVGRTGTDKSEWFVNSNPAVELKTDRLSAPLEVANYPMNVTVNGVTQDKAGFVIEGRSTNGIEARIAPRSTNVGELAPGDAVGATTPLGDNGTVARGDWFVVHVDATGLNGLLPDDLLSDNVDVSFVQSKRNMNIEPNDFNLSSPGFSFAGDERIVRDPDRKGFYLFVDTAEHGIRAGDRYNVTFSIAADSPLAAEREAVSTELRVVERRVDLQYGGDRIVFENRTTLWADTTLAPGTTVNITATDDDLPPIHMPRTKMVGGDRAFAATFNLSDYKSGRELVVELRDQDRTYDAVVGPLAPETTAAPNTTEPTATETTVAPTTATTGAPTETTAATTTADSTAVGLTQVSSGRESGPLTQRPVKRGSSGVTDVPGFDVAAVVVALLAAGVLAARRT